MSISSVIAGGEHTCALTSSGGAKCWGLNSYGQLGDGTTTSSSTPVSVSGLTGGTTAVMTGMSYHSCARTLSDGLKCWGLNLYGQLGDGTELPASTTPVTLSVATGTYASNATHKHAVSSVSNQLSVDSYQYDANGNMTQRVEGGQTYTQTFDAENRLISVTVNSQTTQLIYDGDGNLIKKINPDNSKTLYVGGLYEVNKNAGGTVTGTTTYYPASGAMRVNGTLYYVLKDHLGSASVVTDSSGNIVGEQRYYPFGETRLMTGTLYTDKLFTGQRNIAGLGIYHYQSRFYSPKLGRFLSADSLVPNPFNPQDYSRYSYVRNNPVKYTDPSGHRACITQEECADMGTTPNGGRNLPKPKKTPGGGNDRDRGGDNAFPDPNPNGLPAPVIGPSLSSGGGNILELSKDDDASLTPTTTTPSTQPTEAQQLGNFFEAFDILGSMAEGGFFFFLTITVALATCAGAGAACILVLPIYYFMAVMFLQHGYNGYQEYRRIKYDPSVDPTGREVVDFFLPFLKKEK